VLGRGARKRFACGDASLQFPPLVLAQSPGVVSSSSQHVDSSKISTWNVTNLLRRPVETAQPIPAFVPCCQQIERLYAGNRRTSAMERAVRKQHCQ
jgi:hypothetical protein